MPAPTFAGENAHRDFFRSLTAHPPGRTGLQPAPRLGFRPMRLRFHVGPNAFGNALGESLARVDWGNSTDVEAENKGLNASLRLAKIKAISGLSSLPADQNALYLEPDQIERLESAVKSGRPVAADETLKAFIEKVGIEGKTSLVGSSRSGFKTYYENETAKEVVNFLTQLGGDKLPAAIGFSRPGVADEAAYRSMLDYVGSYASEETRYRMSIEAGSSSTKLFKYNDAGIVDLTQGLQESFSAMDAKLVGKGYISQRSFDLYQERVARGDAYPGEPTHADSMARARNQEYYFDDSAPARLRDGARAAASAEPGTLLARAALEIAAIVPWGRLAAKVGTFAESAGRRIGTFGRTARVEGELTSDILGFVPGKGILANRKQMRDFYAEANSYGYKVTVDSTLTQAKVDHRAKVVFLRSEQSEIGTLVDEYTHIWNKANGRGRHLPEDLANIHKSMTGKGTAGFTPAENTLYHQLEFANMWYSGEKSLPSFVRAVPRSEVRYFINQMRDIAATLGKL